MHFSKFLYLLAIKLKTLNSNTIILNKYYFYENN